MSVYRFRADTGVCPYGSKFPDVGVTPCDYPRGYMHVESHFRADTGVCPYAYIFPEVGVTPCGYQPDYMHGESHFRADTGVCPYTSNFPDVGVTPCGYPLVKCMEFHISGLTQGSAPTPIYSQR